MKISLYFYFLFLLPRGGQNVIFWGAEVKQIYYFSFFDGFGDHLTENLVICNIKGTLHHCTLLLGVHMASSKCEGNYFSDSFGPNY